ncbi:ADP-ribosylglycohydrolase family protein [Sutterella sp.]|uniref:ADP-ribosylglycohydrolase family protein n=1 Tax=Sutterella sp. TaxID=1981025 RepID=UPI0026E04CA5|nr:ADP-ribosylglycohydrolase family protein [Sutterella sp.]MDO5530575.1 ADP-ribosylglycohydrolase family protein [Sutterella sp.]
MTIQLENHIAGALAGMVLGDALGVPGELWPREKVRGRYGHIDTFLDGAEDNIVACYFKAGHYTDDSAQAFVILKALLKAGTVPEQKVLADDLLEWVRSMNGFEINLLGPSSKASLLAWSKGEDAAPVTKLSLTNGAGMRIAPVGCIVDAAEPAKLAETVARVSRVTHSTDVAISGAAMVAQAVASAVAGRSWEEMLADVKAMHPIAMNLGEPTWAASILARLEVFEKLVLAHREDYDDERVSRFIYDVIGTGTMTSESVTAALCVAFWCRDAWKAAEMCANMGGDTDTIGAMAAAICGAWSGIDGIPAETVAYLEKTNGLDFRALAHETALLRERFIL